MKQSTLALFAIIAVAVATAVVWATVPAVPSAADDDYDDLAPLDVHARTSAAIVDRLNHHHLIKSKPLDDETSSLIFDRYLKFLDPKHMFFRGSDVAALEKHRTELDDALRQGELQPAFDIYNAFRRRALERIAYEAELLRQGVQQFDFTIDESVRLDREEAAWPASEAEAKDIWRRRLKSRVLAGKLAGESLDEIGETLTKRLKNSLRLIRQTGSEDVFQVFVNAFMQTYDKHTQYFSPRDSADFDIHMSLSLEGIGAVLGTEDEYTVVMRLVKGGPADLDGKLQVSDRIVAVSQSTNEPFVDIVGWRTDEVVELIRGPKGSPVLLKVLPEGPEETNTQVVEIVRDVVKLEDQAASKSTLDIEHGGRQHRIGVVVVPTFYIDVQAMRAGDPNYPSVTRDVARLIAELKEDGMEALIIDLRNNGGGLLHEAVELASLFVESGPVVQVTNLRQKPHVYRDVDETAIWTGPLAVIVNGASASASEIFAGAIQDYGLGLVVGSRTFGKGTVQTLIPLQRGELKLTERRFFRVSGEGTEQNGVDPDIAFPVPEGRFSTSSPLIGAIDMLHATIPAAKFQPRDQVAPLLDTLRLRHDERSFHDPEFAYLRARKERLERVQERSVLSLQEETRLAEKAADEAWLLEVENALLLARGEQPVTTVEELNERREAETLEESLPQDDTLVRETANILADFISLSRPLASANSVPAKTPAVIDGTARATVN